MTLDQDRLASLLRALDASAGRQPRNGTVIFRHHTFDVRPPRPGLVLDPRSAGTAFWNAYLTDDPTVQLQMSEVAPEVGPAAVQRFVRRFANPAMSSAVELRFGKTTLHLSPSSYGDLLGARRAGHQLRPTVKAHALARVARQQLVGAEINRPKPATVALVAGRPQVVSAQTGSSYAPRDVAIALVRAITSPHRTARVRATPARSSFTDADARALGIRQKLSSYTVHVPRAARGDALAAAVRRLDGTVLKPDESLSLRGRLGPATPDGAAGDALATTLFNSAWLGGLQVTNHATSRTYTGKEPVGRDASLRHGNGVAFTDDTSYGVLVAVSANGGSLTTTLWSSPSLDDPIDPQPPHARREGRTRRPSGQAVHPPRRTRRVPGHGDPQLRARWCRRPHDVVHVRYAPKAAVVCKSRHHGITTKAAEQPMPAFRSSAWSRSCAASSTCLCRHSDAR